MSHRRPGTAQSRSPQATFTAKMTSNQKTQTPKTAPQGSTTVRTAVARARWAVSAATPHLQDVHLSRVLGGDTPSDPPLALGEARPEPQTAASPVRLSWPVSHDPWPGGGNVHARKPRWERGDCVAEPQARPHGGLSPPARAAGLGAAQEAMGPDKAALSSRVPRRSRCHGRLPAPSASDGRLHTAASQTRDGHAGGGHSGGGPTSLQSSRHLKTDSQPVPNSPRSLSPTASKV